MPLTQEHAHEISVTMQTGAEMLCRKGLTVTLCLLIACVGLHDKHASTDPGAIVFLVKIM